MLKSFKFRYINFWIITQIKIIYYLDILNTNRIKYNNLGKYKLKYFKYKFEGANVFSVEKLVLSCAWKNIHANTSTQIQHFLGLYFFTSKKITKISVFELWALIEF